MALTEMGDPGTGSVQPPFRIGVQSDLRPGPGNTNWRRRYEEFRDEAIFIDGLGYQSLRLPEQHGTDDGMLPAPLVALASVATITSQVRLMTYALQLPLHQIRRLVADASLIDVISGGRLDLGVAVGHIPRDFDLFGVDISQRGPMVEEMLPLLRQGLSEGVLPDGPGGALVPVSPTPVQEPVPILVGGLARPAIDRAVRLGDGCLAYDYISPELAFPQFWEEILDPALSRHGRSLDDFRFVASMTVWVTDDPERDWETLIGPAMEFRQRQYQAWVGEEGVLYGMTGEAIRHGVVIGSAEKVAEQLLAIWRLAPWHELGFWYRLPGVPHERAMEHLEVVVKQLIPALVAKAG